MDIIPKKDSITVMQWHERPKLVPSPSICSLNDYNLYTMMVQKSEYIDIQTWWDISVTLTWQLDQNTFEIQSKGHLHHLEHNARGDCHYQCLGSPPLSPLLSKKPLELKANANTVLPEVPRDEHTAVMMCPLTGVKDKRQNWITAWVSRAVLLLMLRPLPANPDSNTLMQRTGRGCGGGKGGTIL